MAKLTITIEDMGPRVEFKMSPSAETLFKKIASHGPESLTAAEAYAMACVNRVRELGGSKASRIIVPVQRVRRS